MKVSDWVYYRQTEQKWCGPYQIIKRRRNTYTIQVKRTAQTFRKCDLFLISENCNKAFVPRRPRCISLNILQTKKQEQTYLVEAIAGFKVENHRAFILVQWQDYPGQDTWEPVEDFVTHGDYLFHTHGLQ